MFKNRPDTRICNYCSSLALNKWTVSNWEDAEIRKLVSRWTEDEIRCRITVRFYNNRWNSWVAEGTIAPRSFRSGDKLKWWSQKFHQVKNIVSSHRTFSHFSRRQRQVALSFLEPWFYVRQGWLIFLRQSDAVPTAWVWNQHCRCELYAVTSMRTSRNVIGPLGGFVLLRLRSSGRYFFFVIFK